MLAAPGLLAQAAEGGQLGEMAAELAAFLADATQCGVVLATLAEEMPIPETLELLDLLRTKLGIRPDLVVANGMSPEFASRPDRRPRDRPVADAPPAERGGAGRCAAWIAPWWNCPCSPWTGERRWWTSAARSWRRP